MLFLSIFYFLSRLPFLRTYPVFYDSFEYSKIAEIINFSNFTPVISSSHQPIHTLYFLTILLCKEMFFFLPTNAVLALISLVFGFLTVVFWYLFIKESLGSKKAFFASLLLLLFPYFFLAGTNILYESELLFFQIIGLYLTSKGINGNHLFKIFLGVFFYGLSISVFAGSLIILPVYVLIFQQKKLSRRVFFLLLSVFIPVGLDLLVFRNSTLILAKYQLHFGDLASANKGVLILIFRILRNVVVESAAILSWPAAILTATVSLASTLYLLPSTPTFNLLSSIVWFAPAVLLMQFWHSGLFGRLAIFLIFPASTILTKTLTKKWQKVFLLFCLMIFLIPKLIAQTKIPPIYRYYDLIKDVPNVVILTADSNRFLYQKNNIPIFVFNAGNDLPEAERFVKENLQADKTVLIDSTGLTYPYFQFDGNFYHLLSLHPKSPPHVTPLLQKFKTEIFKIDSKDKRIYFSRIFP